MTSPIPTLHLFVLLDRSGSMEAMRYDVIAGFNELIAEQKAATANGEPEPRITLVQFDDVDLHDVVLNAAKIGKATGLTDETFVPRGVTPLLDATAALLDRAEKRAKSRAKAGRPAEAIVMVTITDGAENASVRTSRRDVLERVRRLESEGWTFAFLGANLDSYDEAGRLGYDARSVQNFRADGGGAQHALKSVSRATTARRRHLLSPMAFEHRDFFEGDKEAEADLEQRPTGRAKSDDE